MKTVVAALLVVCALYTSSVQAQSMHSIQALQDGVYYSDQFQGKTLWISYKIPGYSGTYAASAVRLNAHWGITAAHIFEAFGEVHYDHQIGDGTNYSDPALRGNIRNITEYHVHPTWDGIGEGGPIDLAVFRWNQPLAGQNVTFGNVSIGDVITYSGFGRDATPATGYLNGPRVRRAFDMKIEWFGGPGLPTDYARGMFLPYGHHLYLPDGGNMTPGSSGSGGFRANGELVTIATYFVGPVSYGSTTSGPRVGMHAAWINSYINRPSRPTIISLSADAADIANVTSATSIVPCALPGEC